MKRTIQLTRLHALNWYGYKDTITVEGNLLLAGVTGSGKSILMDLIQLVLIGDQRLVRFNQSATGDRSDRTLKGYCLGDTKQEENGITQYMRQSAISYVALEFTWPNGKKVETWGMRVEFVSAAEAHGKVTPFFIPASLNRSDFLDASKCPLDYLLFKALVENHSGRLYSEGIESYLRDMAQPGHLNFDRDVLRSLLPMAMSFTFLKSFNDFARHFILPADQLNIRDVTASYRTFLTYERDLIELNDQFKQLGAIADLFKELTDLRRDRALARYLEAQLRYEQASEQLKSTETNFDNLRRTYTTEESRLAELSNQIPALKEKIDRLKATIKELPNGPLYIELTARNKKLAGEINDLTGIGKTLEDALENRRRNALIWLKELRSLPLELDTESVSAVERAVQVLANGGINKAGETLPALMVAAKQAAAAVSSAGGTTLKRLFEIRHKLGYLRGEVAALTVGKLPFPTRLLDLLNSKLLSRHADLPAKHIRELCEVTDERWRPAIEIAFTRKFAVVVATEHYEEAEKIYYALQASELGGDFSRESLVNPTKALHRRKPVKAGSLAEKLKTADSVVDAVISEAFGNLMCVEHREDFRLHDFAIMPDGFTSRGAFVERSRFYDGNPFVGRKGLQQQLEWKKKQIEDLVNAERKLEPLERALKAINEGYREHFDIPPSLYNDLAIARKLPDLKAEFSDSIQRLNSIDRSKFDDLAQDVSKYESGLATMENERRALDRSPMRTEVDRLKSLVEFARVEVKKLADRFKLIRNEVDVSPWLVRLEELRKEIIGQFPAKDVAAGEFNSMFHRFNREEGETWSNLKAKRRELAIAHQKFDDLPSESEDNAPYAKQLAKLQESEIPDYTTKAQRERKNWEQLFRTQVLEKLHTALKEVKDRLSILTVELKKRPIGTNTYALTYWQNPDYKTYHELLEASTLAREDDLFFASADQRFRDAIDHFLKVLTETPDGAEAARLLDYRHYYEYDMEVIEADGRKTSVDRHSGKFSGGENQSPYFIAILASYLRAYRRYSSVRKQEPSLGLVPIDEAFSKLSGERIKDCITALKAFDLQGVFSMSTGNIPYAFEHCDWLVVVSKDERRNGKRTEIRNIPVSLARESEDAHRLMNP